MYVSPNYKSKKALKEAVAEGVEVTIFQPNNLFGTRVPTDGTVTVEGPHYPAPHSWYASVTLEGGRVVGVDGKRLRPNQKSVGLTP